MIWPRSLSLLSRWIVVDPAAAIARAISDVRIGRSRISATIFASSAAAASRLAWLPPFPGRAG